MNITSIRTGIPNCAQKVKNCMKQGVCWGALGLSSLGALHVAQQVCSPNQETIPEKIIERGSTYSGLMKNGVDITPYLGNYAKAKAAIDSIRYENGDISYMDYIESKNKLTQSELLSPVEKNAVDIMKEVAENMETVNKQN